MKYFPWPSTLGCPPLQFRGGATQYSGSDIQLAVSKVTAVMGKPSRVVFGNPGGPCAAGLGMAAYIASEARLAKPPASERRVPRGLRELGGQV